MTLKQKRNFRKGILIAVMCLIALIYIYPVFLMFMNSFKPFGEIVKDAIAFPSKAEFENYTYVIDKIKYPKLFMNNVVITVTGPAGIVLFSSMAAYMMDRRKNRYTKIAHLLITTPMLIPFQTIMITLLKAMNVIHLSGSKLGLGVQYWGFGIPMATFIFYNFMKTIPRELDESAMIDGMTVGELVQKFEKGEVKIADLPEIYDNFFEMIDLAVEYGDDKPLETDLSGELAAYDGGTAAMVLGQGAWIEADSLAIDPELQVGFAGYPVSGNPDQCQIISGSDQALHVAADSDALQATLDFVNWWYTSDYGIAWFTDVAGVVPPVKTDAESDFQIIKQGASLEAANGSAPLGICYSTDSWWQKFGELMQDYIAGTTDKDATCAAIEENWAAIDGAAE